MEYRCGSHTGHNINYDFVCVTKYRYKVLTGDGALPVRELARQTCEEFEIRMFNGAAGKDHVRGFVSAPPTMAPSEIAKALKKRTARKLFEEFRRLNKRYRDRHFSARGYFCATAGQVSDEMIQMYLEHHFEPSGDDKFKTDGEASL